MFDEPGDGARQPDGEHRRRGGEQRQDADDRDSGLHQGTGRGPDGHGTANPPARPSDERARRRIERRPADGA
jgi:hypothetical protein